MDQSMERPDNRDVRIQSWHISATQKKFEQTMTDDRLDKISATKDQLQIVMLVNLSDLA